MKPALWARTIGRAALWLTVSSLGSGCTERTDLLPPVDGGPVACSGLGSPVRLGGSDGACAGALAAATLGRALCSCNSIILAGNLATESSGNGSGGGGGPGSGPPPDGPSSTPAADVASDGSIEIGGNVQVAGSISAGASNGIGFNRSAAIFGGLQSGGSLVSEQLVAIGSDAYVAGDVLGRVDVGGTLHVSPSSNVSPLASGNYIVREPIAIEPPCACAAGPVVDVNALIGDAFNHNDNATGGLDATTLTSTHGPTVFDLPCGSYYLPSLTSDDTLQVRVHGRSALFIDGDVDLADGLRVTLDSGAELDLFVAGDVDLQAGQLGASSPAAVRLWLASTVIQLGADASLSAIVYAPGATVLPQQDLMAAGALFVGAIAAPGDVTVRFDSNVLDDGAACSSTTVSDDLGLH